MAMYLFASRLSSAVCARREGAAPRPSVDSAHVQSSVSLSAHASSTDSPTAQSQSSPEPSTSRAPFCTVRSGSAGCCRKAQPVPPPRVPTVSQTVPLLPTGSPSTLLSPRSQSTMASLVSQTSMLTQISAVSPTNSNTAVPSLSSDNPKHRVRFSNTFPRIHRKKNSPKKTKQESMTTDNFTEADREFESETLVYTDGNLSSGTLDGLIQLMVPTLDYFPDKSFLFTFLLSSRLFIKPYELLGRVAALCEGNHRALEKQGFTKVTVMPRLTQILSEWSETFPYDFRDERMMAHVRSITQRCVVSVGAGGEARIRREVSSLLQNLLLRLTALEKYEEFLLRVKAEKTANNFTALDASSAADFCSSVGLCEQLTLVECERLSLVGPEEFVQALVQESNPQSRDVKRTRNLEAYMSWSDHLSRFVASEVVRQVKKKPRARVLQFWIDTASECLNMGNFNSLMAIVSGLNMAPIARLKKTWSKVDRYKFTLLELQTDPASNFGHYRSSLKAARNSSTTGVEWRGVVVVPFFSLLLKDVIVLHEGCSDRLPNGHINFEKFWQLAKQVMEFLSWKQVSCPFVRNEDVLTLLQMAPVLSENGLELASFLCENPVTQFDKERLKTLRSEMNIKD